MALSGEYGNSPRVDRSFWRARRVLVTGHTGFKGAWLALWLQSLGATVVGLSDGVPTEPSLFEVARIGDEVAAVSVDIRDAVAVEHAIATHAPEVVIHMAAQSLVRLSFAEPTLTYTTNVIGTANVLEAARRHESVRVVVAVTSDKCYENRGDDRAYREEDPLGGSDPYSSSKACAELLADSFRRSYFSAPAWRPRVATARAGNVIGGGDWATDRLVPDVMRAALRGDTVRVRNPQAIRPWQHVLNPLYGYLLLAEKLWSDAAQARAWNFGPADADARSVEWMVGRIAARWPRPLRVEIDDGPHPPEADRLRLDSSRARTQLLWHPRWDLDDGLDAVVDWHVRHREGEDMQAVSLEQIDCFERTATRG